MAANRRRTAGVHSRARGSCRHWTTAPSTTTRPLLPTASMAGGDAGHVQHSGSRRLPGRPRRSSFTFGPRSRVQHVLRFRPAAAGLIDAEAHGIEADGRVGVRRDRDLEPEVLGHPAVHVVVGRAARMRVELDAVDPRPPRAVQTPAGEVDLQPDVRRRACRWMGARMLKQRLSIAGVRVLVLLPRGRDRSGSGSRRPGSSRFRIALPASQLAAVARMSTDRAFPGYRSSPADRRGGRSSRAQPPGASRRAGAQRRRSEWSAIARYA